MEFDELILKHHNPQCQDCGSFDVIGFSLTATHCRACGSKNIVGHQYKWDLRWLEKAREASRFSKDPSTKTGAIIIGPENDIVSQGYNGFARGVKDLPERYADRDHKIAVIIHCEENAILFADRWRLKGSTLYTWPFHSCAKCSSMVIQAGIKRCVAPKTPPEFEGRWGENLKIARQQFSEAGVELSLLTFPAETNEGVARG